MSSSISAIATGVGLMVVPGLQLVGAGMIAAGVGSIAYGAGEMLDSTAHINPIRDFAVTKLGMSNMEYDLTRAVLTGISGYGIAGYGGLAAAGRAAMKSQANNAEVKNEVIPEAVAGDNKGSFLKGIPNLENDVTKADDFAKTTFLPEEYYTKLDNNIAKAINARDAEVARIQSLSNTQQSKIATVVGGVDLRTGKVVVGVKNSKIYKGNAICAEDLVFGELGGNTNANIIMTPAIRPRTGQTIPVCTRCQLKFPKNQFIKGTVFD